MESESNQTGVSVCASENNVTGESTGKKGETKQGPTNKEWGSHAQVVRAARPTMTKTMVDRRDNTKVSK